FAISETAFAISETAFAISETAFAISETAFAISATPEMAFETAIAISAMTMPAACIANWETWLHESVGVSKQLPLRFPLWQEQEEN
ncbi:MAG: hypothetical protein V7L07_02135, partial [Nostoc sp.]